MVPAAHVSAALRRFARQRKMLWRASPMSALVPVGENREFTNSNNAFIYGNLSLRFSTQLPQLKTDEVVIEQPTGEVYNSEQAAKFSRPASRRKVVAHSIPQWLSKDQDWRDRTMEFLNLPTGNTPQTQETLRQEYRNFYKNSLQSFAEILLTEPPLEIHDAMNRLANAGFSDTFWSKSYRVMTSYCNKHKNILSSIEAQKKESRKCSARLRKTTASLQILRTKLSQLPAPSMQENGISSLWQRTVETFQEVLGSPSMPAHSGLTSDITVQLERTSLETRIGQLENVEQQIQNEIATANRTLSRLNERLELLEKPLTMDDYNAARDVTLEVMDPICRVFANHIHSRHSLMVVQYQMLDNKTDLTKPHEWYPHARLNRRKVIYHGGPTNSGKTYEALERLKLANKGMYLGPLRLLAAEIYEKLTAAGVYCNLYTGQERREIPFATHGAATVEMASVVDDFDVVVIDEIQMIEDQERGFAWTRALLGSRAKEIHVCGGLEAKEIVERIAKACGDDFELRTYKRFAELKVSVQCLAKSLKDVNSYKNVQAGDCIVAFSRNDIFAIKREIETATSYKCCVIYGSLPPETRSEQARRFNNPNSGYDILVASDAIAMGLNLSIRRIIFNSIYKHDGTGIVRLGHSAVKQISGRAGRRNSLYPFGEVTCRVPEDMEYLRQCMGTEIKTIKKAGLMPTTSHIEMFSATLEQYGLGPGSHRLHTILLRFNDMATIQSEFFMCRQTPVRDEF
jgi:ATP-dependent RNA helicase SUPV3L1/SUV3